MSRATAGAEGRRVLLTGAGGQLAADLAATFGAAGYEVQAYRREELDIADDAAVRQSLQDLRPELILNPAAYNRVDDAEADPALAFTVNAFGPRVLARGAAEIGATLVHFSTDYVVDGAARRPYGEGDLPRPLSVYASSKLSGEHLVQAIAPCYYVLRVCGLFGHAGRTSRHGNFVETMLRLAAAGRPLRVVADQTVAPTSSGDVATTTLALVTAAAPWGLYHCTAAGETSWYEFARAIFAETGVEAQLSPTTAADYGAPARRPAYSILDNTKLAAAGVQRPRHWRDALRAYLAERRGVVGQA